MVPPPLGAFAERARTRWDCRRWRGGGAGQRLVGQQAASVVGDGELIGRSGDGDQAPMMRAVVIGAQQHQITNKSLIYLRSERA